MHSAGLERGTPEYERLKEERSQVLWRAVERVIPDVRQRAEIALVRLCCLDACMLLEGLCPFYIIHSCKFYPAPRMLARMMLVHMHPQQYPTPRP